MKKVTLVLKSCENCPYLARKETTGDSQGRILVNYVCQLSGAVVSSLLASWRHLEFTVESGENMHYLKNAVHPKCPLEDYDIQETMAVTSTELRIRSQQPTQASIDLSLLEKQTKNLEEEEDGWEP